jgi:entericidin B
MIRKTLIALAMSGLVLTATACNTVKGLGEDIKSVGQAGERAID